MKNIYILLALLLPMAVWSQGDLTIHLLLRTPVMLGEFREVSNQSVRVGLGMNFYVRPSPASPWQMGISMSAFERGSENKTARLRIKSREDEYELKASNGTGSFSALLQLEPWAYRIIRPYVEGEMGSHVFYSDVTFRLKQGGGDWQSLSKTEATRIHGAFFFGGSIGINVSSEDRFLGINLKCSYLRGSKTAYNDHPHFTDTGIAQFERLHSRTDLLIPQIGLWINIEGAGMFKRKSKAEQEPE